jgi:hypothetical protein
MSDCDLEEIGALLSGLLLAFVRLGVALDEKGVLSRNELADSLRKEAAGLSGAAAVVLNQAARALEGRIPEPDAGRTVLTLVPPKSSS